MAKGVGNSTNKLHYIKPHTEQWESAHKNYRQYEVEQAPYWYTRLIHGYLITIDWQPACTNAACAKQTPTIKHSSWSAFNGGIAKKYPV